MWPIGGWRYIIGLVNVDSGREAMFDKGLKMSVTPVILVAGGLLAAPQSNLEVLDVRIDPIRQGKNVVRVEVTNRSDTKQVFAIRIYTQSPDYGRRGMGWVATFFDTVEAKSSKSSRQVFKIHGPVTDRTWLRLQFYNPASVEDYDYKQPFKVSKFLSNDLKVRPLVPYRFEPAPAKQAEEIMKVFKRVQGYIADKEYEKAWGFFTEDYHKAEFQNRGLERFKQVMNARNLVESAFSWERNDFVRLQAKEATLRDDLFALQGRLEEQSWTIDFVEDDGRWKIDWIAGYTPRLVLWQNWEERLLPTMEKGSTKHFDIYHQKGSAAEKDIEKIASDREAAYSAINEFLGTKSPLRIKLIFFESEETKWFETGWQGRGWAYGNTMVEVYNEQEQLDPYHETTHVLMGSYGDPPALFNEGFAVYLSERSGAHALDDLSGGQATIYERVRELKARGELIDLRKLLGYTEIGSKQSRPPVAYPEAASFVKFLIDTYGKDKFLNAYRTLQNSDSEAAHQENIRTLEQIYGESLTELETKWQSAFLTAK
jgi:hypothetical protein